MKSSRKRHESREEKQAGTTPTAEGTRQTIKKHRVVWGIVVLGLCVHAALAIDTARRYSVTHDEYWHLPVGLLNLRTAKFYYDNLNPPLVRMWAAIPLLWTANPILAPDAPLDATAYGDQFVRANPKSYDRLYAHGRFMIVLLSVATGAVLAIWARELFGNRAACLTVLFWSFSPTVLMSASLATTDLGAVFFFVVTLYATFKHAQQPTWRRAGWLGLWLGLAQLAKFTALLLYPISIVMWLILRGVKHRAQTKSSRILLLQWFMMISLSLLVLNTGYLFRGSFSQLGSYKLQSKTFSGIANGLRGFRRLPIPLPRDYVEGVDRQRHVMESEHPVFLDNTWSLVGFRSYYLMAMWYKLPHVLMLMVLLAVLFLIWPGNKSRMSGRRVHFAH